MSEESRHVSTMIERSAAEVYDYAVDPANLSSWAAGLAQSPVRLVDGRWRADSPMGMVEVAFVERNDLGVLDHVVTLPTGVAVYNPMRVITAGDGCEVVFTVRRQPEMDDAAFEADCAAVSTDLATLARLVENRSAHVN